MRRLLAWRTSDGTSPGSHERTTQLVSGRRIARGSLPPGPLQRQVKFQLRSQQRVPEARARVLVGRPGDLVAQSIDIPQQLHFLGDEARALEDGVPHTLVRGHLEVLVEVDSATPWKMVELTLAHRLA